MAQETTHFQHNVIYFRYASTVKTVRSKIKPICRIIFITTHFKTAEKKRLKKGNPKHAEKPNQQASKHKRNRIPSQKQSLSVIKNNPSLVNRFKQTGIKRNPEKTKNNRLSETDQTRGIKIGKTRNRRTWVLGDGDGKLSSTSF